MTLQRRVDEILDSTPGMTWQEALQIAANEPRVDPFETMRRAALTHNAK